MRYAATNIDLIQRDPVEPNPHDLSARIAELIPMIKTRPPRMEYIFEGLPCLATDNTAFRIALRDRDGCELGRMVLAYFDAYCENEANDLAYGELVDDLTPRDYAVLADIGEDRRFRA